MVFSFAHILIISLLWKQKSLSAFIGSLTTALHPHFTTRKLFVIRCLGRKVNLPILSTRLSLSKQKKKKPVEFRLVEPFL
jgi:hypothetical protein